MGRIQPSQKLFDAAVIGVNQVCEFMDHDKTEQAWKGEPMRSWWLSFRFCSCSFPATFHFPDGERVLFDYFEKRVAPSRTLLLCRHGCPFGALPKHPRDCPDNRWPPPWFRKEALNQAFREANGVFRKDRSFCISGRPKCQASVPSPHGWWGLFQAKRGSFPKI